MCTTCGCGTDAVTIDGKAHSHGHDHPHDHDHHHDHDHDHGHDHHDHGPAHAHAAGVRAERAVAVERAILAKNDAEANANRRGFTASGILALNLVSSPGSGKTTLLVETIRRLAGDIPIAVIEGDQQTSNDADRIRATGARAVQINTGKGCHLDAHMVGHALETLAPRAGLGAHDRERRQPRLPGGLRPGRGAQGGGALRHRRARTSPSSTRTCSPPPTSCSSTSATCCRTWTFDVDLCVANAPPRQPGDPGAARLRDEGRGHRRLARLDEGRGPRGALAAHPRGRGRRLRGALHLRLSTGNLRRPWTPSPESPPERQRVRVRGTVQGVGFRPFVWRLAQRAGARRLGAERRRGRARGGAGRAADACGVPAPRGRRRAAARARRRGRARGMPAAARAAGFAIAASRGGTATTPVTPDAATCADCLRRALRPGRPPLPLPVHQLHPLRPALHHHARRALRPAAHHDGGLRDVPGVRARVRATRPTGASTPSPTPARSAGRGSRCWARTARRCDRATPSPPRSRSSAPARSWRSRAWAASTWSATRATCAPWRGCAPQAPRREALRRDGGQRRHARRPSRTSTTTRGACSNRRERPIVLLPQAPGLRRGARRRRPRRAALGAMLPYTPLHWLLFFEANGARGGTGGRASRRNSCS